MTFVHQREGEDAHCVKITESSKEKLTRGGEVGYLLEEEKNWAVEMMTKNETERLTSTRRHRKGILGCFRKGDFHRKCFPRQRKTR